MEEVNVIEQWLNTMSTGRREHKCNLLLFLDFTDKSAQQILDEYKACSKKQFKKAVQKSSSKKLTLNRFWTSRRI